MSALSFIFKIKLFVVKFRPFIYTFFIAHQTSKILNNQRGDEFLWQMIINAITKIVVVELMMMRTIAVRSARRLIPTD